MTDAERLIEKVAEALWMAFVAQHVRSKDCPTWGELLAQGHQGLGRVNQFRALARAALAVVEPVVREDEREAIIRAMKRRWKGGYPGEVIADLEAAIRARGAA